MSWNLGTDTEGTGLYIKHGCRPFFVSGFDNNGDKYSWEWHVNPKTRMPVVPKKDIREIEDLYNAVDKLIFWNCKYDLHALQAVGVRLPPWDKIYDASTELHVLSPAQYNSVGKALKPCALKFSNGEIGLDDQTKLKQVCIRARNIAKKLGWSVANPDHPHFKPASKSPRDGWSVCDMWIPRQIALLPTWREFLSSEEREVWLTVCREYAMTDAYRTMYLHEVFWPQIIKQKMLKQFRMQQAVFCPLYAIEDYGFPVLPKKLAAQQEKLGQIAAGHEQKAVQIVKKITGNEINVRSYKQMTEFLFQKLKLPIIKYTKDAKTKRQSNRPSTDFETLLRLRFTPEYTKRMSPEVRKLTQEFLHNVLSYAKINTGVKYIRGYEANRIKNRIYATAWNQGTSTTRISFSDPNLQNVGKGGATSGIEDPEIKLFLEELSEDNETLRCVFGPEEGTFWYDIDYSQLQLRIFAFVAGEKSLIDAFDAGWDAHTFVARRIFRLRDDETPTKHQRRIAKAVNFGFIFGAQPEKIELTAGRPGLWDDVIHIFPSAHRYMETIKRQVRRYGYVHTPGGYRLSCDKPHKGVNFIVQGAEGEIVKRAMIETHRYTLNELRKQKNINARLILQVHDELIFAFPKSSTKIEQQSYMDEGKEQTGIVLTNNEHVIRLKQIMEDAGAYYGIKTPADPEVVLESWDKSFKILST